jgi:hypothetical protein
MFGGSISGGPRPRKTQLLGPPHTEPGRIDPLAVLQVQREQLGPQRSKAFHEVARLFNSLVDTHIMEHLQQRPLRDRDPHAIWLIDQGLQTGLGRQAGVERGAGRVSGRKMFVEPPRQSRVV